MKQTKIKKLTLGVLAATVAITPIIAVSCGKKETKKTFMEKVNDSKKPLLKKMNNAIALNHSIHIELKSSSKRKDIEDLELIKSILFPEIPTVRDFFYTIMFANKVDGLKNSIKLEESLLKQKANNKTSTEKPTNKDMAKHYEKESKEWESILEEILEIKYIEIVNIKGITHIYTLSPEIRKASRDYLISAWEYLKYLGVEDVVKTIPLMDLANEEKKRKYDEFLKTEFGKGFNEVLKKYGAAINKGKKENLKKMGILAKTVK
ncbi:MAG: hypothetical protein HRT98_03435 [Mycoplasmatales bacterium]|nr:hypothetical protein [Mycoplasmatales bacterium]